MILLKQRAGHFLVSSLYFLIHTKAKDNHARDWRINNTVQRHLSKVMGFTEKFWVVFPSDLERSGFA